MKSYLIKKGNHYADITLGNRISSLGWKVKRTSIRFRFHKECWWAPPRNDNDRDLNKLCGIGYGLNHQKNSVRLAWVPDFNVNGKINIYGYIYDERADGNHLSAFIHSVQVETNNTALITNSGSKYEFLVNGKFAEMPNTHADPSLCFMLYPYFGGNNTAPHDMVIELEVN